MPAEWLPAKELPSDEYPFVLNTGRLLEHWHTGSMTRRSFALDAIQPSALYLNPRDAARWVSPRATTCASPRGAAASSCARAVSHRDTPGTCFIPFHFREAAANLLTIDEIDPFGKIPEFKFCAVRIERSADGGPEQAATVSEEAPPGAAMACAAGAPPGTEARAGKFPGPTLMPELTAIQREHGWLPREQLAELSREMDRPLYEIEGLISFYPHFRTEPPSKIDLHVCHDLSCWLHGSDERIAEIGRATGTTSRSRSRRSRAWAAATSPPRLRSTNGRAGGRSRSARRGRPEGCAGRGKGVPGDAPAPTIPTRRARSATGSCAARSRAKSTPTTSSRRSRTRGCAAWAVRAFPPGQSGSSSASRRTRRSTPSATRMSPSPRRSRTGRSWPSSRTWSSRGCCSGCWRPVRKRAGCSSATSTGRRRRCSARSSSPCARGRAQRTRSGGVRLEVDIFTSPGGYILGEESALLECMEGHRGEPRNKPPFPGVYGLWGQPTLMN